AVRDEVVDGARTEPLSHVGQVRHPRVVVLTRAGGDAHRDFRPEDLCLAVALPPVGEQLGAERSNVLWSEVHFLCSPDKPPAPRGRRAPTGNRRYWGLV